ncbi:MAG: DUF4276 family protein [Anaerolineales bacterium]
MKQLVLALYAEGSTDERFLPRIIQRTAEHLLARYGVEILDPHVVNGDIHSRATLQEQIVAAAKETRGYHILIVHQDADAPDQERALQERIQPGLDLAQQEPEHYQQDIVPLIPVRMIEAWMLADPVALCQAIPSCPTPDELNLPHKPEQVEHISDPKAELARITRIYQTRRRRSRSRSYLAKIQERLADEIAIERLKRVPAYQTFEQKFAQVLHELHFLDQ